MGKHGADTESVPVPGDHYGHADVKINVLFSATPTPQILASTHTWSTEPKRLQYAYCGRIPQKRQRTTGWVVLIVGMMDLLPAHESRYAGRRAARRRCCAKPSPMQGDRPGQ